MQVFSKLRWWRNWVYWQSEPVFRRAQKSRTKLWPRNRTVLILQLSGHWVKMRYAFLMLRQVDVSNHSGCAAWKRADCQTSCLHALQEGLPWLAHFLDRGHEQFWFLQWCQIVRLIDARFRHFLMMNNLACPVVFLQVQSIPLLNWQAVMPVPPIHSWMSPSTRRARGPSKGCRAYW